MSARETPQLGFTFRRDTIAEVIARMGADFFAMPAEHWDEAVLARDAMPLDIDTEKYLTLEELGILRLYLAMRGEEVIGYITYILGPHLHYKSTKFAISDTFFIRKEYRSIFSAIGLFRFVEDALRGEGVQVMLTATEAHIPGAGRVLEYMGHKRAEVSYIKTLSAGVG